MSSHWIILSAAGAGFTVGSVLLKQFSDTGAVLALLFAILSLGVGNLAYVRLLAHGLGQGAVMSSMSQIIALSILGALLFGERLGLPQVAGLGLAILSIWLFSQSS
ncbi:MAG: EamA family transporter [Litoreibacter sp.]|nr:EamA family transporter [Litoreibacter sp.]